MDGFNLGEDNEIKSITIKDGKLRFEVRNMVMNRYCTHALARDLSNLATSFASFRSVHLSDQVDFWVTIT
jgi:hypothetical protein